jgi:membrane protein implicated in regulation of membrane protease activity
MGCNEGDWVMANNDGDRTSPNSSSNDTARAFSEPTLSNHSAAEPKRWGSSPMPAIIAGIVVIVILAIFGVGAYFLFIHPAATAVVRDIFIILVGFETMIIGLLIVAVLVAIIYLVLKLYDLVRIVQNEVVPLLNRADDTMRTVQSRATFVSDAAVKPVVEIMAQVAAIRQTIKSFIRPRK